MNTNAICRWFYPRLRHQVTIIGFVRLSLGMSACSHYYLHIHVSYSIPVLSPFLFMPSLYALLFIIHRIFFYLYTSISYEKELTSLIHDNVLALVKELTVMYAEANHEVQSLSIITGNSHQNSVVVGAKFHYFQLQWE